MNLQRRNVWAAGAVFAAAMLFNLASTSTTSAATITHTGFFSDIFGDDFYSSPGSIPTGAIFAEEIITGVDKFDPSLGTLTSVTVYAEFDSSFDFDVFADDVIDDSLSHSVDVDADFLSVFIGYSPGGGSSTTVLISADYSPFSFCSGDPLDSPCADTFGDFISTDGSDIVSTLASFDPTDFIGVGPVTALSAIIAVPVDAFFTLDNVGSAGAELFADMYYFDLSVEYEFTPIPEPSTALLLLLGLAALSRRRP